MDEIYCFSKIAMQTNVAHYEDVKFVWGLYYDLM